MTRKSAVLVCVQVVVLSLSASAAAAQDRVQAETGSSAMEQILVELRLLRAEMSEAAAAALRAQLLAARLALQEQRINITSRELADIQEKLQASERNRPAANLLKSIAEANPHTASPGEPQGLNQFQEFIQNQAAELDKSEQHLKIRYEELSRLLAEDQARWTAFNAQLEALEQTATRKK